jgi:hypothetical protein
MRGGARGGAVQVCTLGTFMGGWAWVFLGTTVAVWLGKREAATPPHGKRNGPPRSTDKNAPPN